MKKISSIFILSLLLVFCCSCNGILGSIYDNKPIADESTGQQYGFIEIDKANNSGTIYINASDYMQWTYVNLHNKTIEIKVIDTANVDAQTEPQDWDFALHRYDVKTNKGAVQATQFATLDELRNSGTRPDGSGFSVDTLGNVTVDMSGMMDGNIKLVPSSINRILSQWLDVNTSVMPPIYTLSKRVYFLQLANKEYAALLFTNYINEESEKGYITIKYIYPY